MVAVKSSDWNPQGKPKLFLQSIGNESVHQDLFCHNMEEEKRENQRKEIHHLRKSIKNCHHLLQQMAGNVYSLRRALNHSIKDHIKLQNEVGQHTELEERTKEGLSKKISQLIRKQQLNEHHFLDRFERNEKMNDQLQEELQEQKSSQQVMRREQRNKHQEMDHSLQYLKQHDNRIWGEMERVNQQLQNVNSEVQSVHSEVQDVNAKVLDYQNQTDQRLQSYDERLQEMEDLYKDEHPYVQLLKSLPPNYPVRRLYVNGTIIPVTHFIRNDPSKGMAYFKNDNQIKTIDSEKIDGIIF
ncbi:hypothetical protein GWK91_02540 [Virgibacillus sp. MSP4-1]|uniref:hypothetical protein n=1 Tax=Virgibacillus sp. MSP4-1 TaxID=2700081 RepID=UPI0003A26C8E|nr:hypothetical protein [Virgibacillus sp. MSP4-1]QHS21885.1 hypothetical protein GWK91_02540 [Virgibacillus sp. MSP4-1]